MRENEKQEFWITSINGTVQTLILVIRNYCTHVLPLLPSNWITQSQSYRHSHITQIQPHKNSVCACAVCGQPDTRLYFSDVAWLLLASNTTEGRCKPPAMYAVSSTVKMQQQSDLINMNAYVWAWVCIFVRGMCEQCVCICVCVSLIRSVCG